MNCFTFALLFFGALSALAQESPNIILKQNQDIMVLAPGRLSPLEEAQVELEALENSDEEDDGPIKLKKIGMDVDSELNYAPSWSWGDKEDDSTHVGHAKVVVDIVNNNSGSVLYSIPVNARISRIKDNGNIIENKVEFDLNVEKILSSKMAVAIGATGYQNDFGDLAQSRALNAGVSYDILGNRMESDKPHVITSLYYMRAKDVLQDGFAEAKNRGSFRIEVRDVTLGDSLRLQGKVDQRLNFANQHDHSTHFEAGMNFISPIEILGSKLSLTPSYSYRRTRVQQDLPVERLHQVNISVSLNIAKLRLNRR